MDAFPNIQLQSLSRQISARQVNGGRGMCKNAFLNFISWTRNASLGGGGTGSYLIKVPHVRIPDGTVSLLVDVPVVPLLLSTFLCQGISKSRHFKRIKKFAKLKID